MADEGKHAGGNAWGNDVSDERKAELEAAYAANLASNQPPYASVRIVSADELHWILGARGWWGASELPIGKHRANLTGIDARGVDLSGIWLTQVQLDRADLTGAALVGAHLAKASLVDAVLLGADLSRSDLSAANLTGAQLGLAQLTSANLKAAILVRADLSAAQLDKANLRAANLAHARAVGSNFSNAWAEQASLAHARVEDADLGGAWLHAADFRHASHAGARMDPRTTLAEAHLDMTTALVDVVWNGAPLTAVDWSHIACLYDELAARQRVTADGKRKGRLRRIADYAVASRAYRQLTVALRNQGMSEDADRFAYRAQVCQRIVLRMKRQGGSWLLQTLLAVLAGYGYRLWRIVAAYVLVLVVFAAIYFALGLPNTKGASILNTVGDAFLVSLTAIHGRVFLEQLGQYSLQAWVAAVESVVGVIIEGVFVAMLVQRFFGGR